MKILLDECLPIKLTKIFQEHEVYTVKDLGWSGKKDKELLSEVSNNKFDVFISVDKGIEKQINITKYNLTIVTLKVPRNTLKALIPMVESFKKDLANLEKNKFYHIKLGLRGFDKIERSD